MAVKNVINNSSDPMDATNLTVASTYTIPNADGSADEVLVTDGLGAATWGAASAGSSLTWSEITTDTNAAVNNAYICNAASSITITLPDTFAVGDVVKLVGKNAGGWRVSPNTGDMIYYLNDYASEDEWFNPTNSRGCCEVVGLVANTSWSITEVEDTGFYSGGAIQIAGGFLSSYTINEDRTLSAWGDADNYSLGDATLVDKSTPIIVHRSYKYIDITGGGWVTGSNVTGFCGLIENHQAVGCGIAGIRGIQSRIGGTVNSVKEPTGIDFDYSYTNISTCNSHTIALKDDSTAWTWGINVRGQLGTGNTTAYYYPVSVIGGYSFIQVSCGVGASPNEYGYSAGLKADGSVWTWGYNANGQLGTGNTTDYSSPVSVTGGHSFIQIQCQAEYMNALKADGSVWCWGPGGFGRLGTGNTTNYSSPVSMIGGHSFIKIGGNQAQAHTIALKADGSAWMCGYNTDGRLGTGNTTHYSSPVSVTGGYSFIDIALGYYHSMALTHDNHVYAWGYNVNGQLGDNSTTSRSSPVSVTGL